MTLNLFSLTAIFLFCFVNSSNGFVSCKTPGSCKDGTVLGEGTVEEEQKVMLLGLGAIASDSNNVEPRANYDLVEIDPDFLSSYGTYCNPLADFPIAGVHSSGEYVHGKIISCGGSLAGEDTKSCYYYSENNKDWSLFGDLANVRYEHDSAILPNGDLWVTGGKDENYENSYTTDVIDKDFNIKEGPILPFGLSAHCVTNWNSTHMLLIGGYQTSSSNRVFFFDINAEKWILAPEMNYNRWGPACVTFVDTDDKTKVMVIGGQGGTSVETGELFDGESWTLIGQLPNEFGYAKAVAYKGQIIVTGEDSDYNPQLFAWVFDIATRTWSSGFPMSPPIKYHDSFLVPKSLCQLV